MDWIEYSPDQIIIPWSSEYTRMSPLDAAVYSVHQIVMSRPPPYTVFASGGLDSQATVLSWLLAGVEFQVCSVRLNGGMNDHDLAAMDQFKKKHTINHFVKDLDIINFFQSTEYPEYVYRYRCGSPHIVAHMKMAELVPEGTVIFSGDPVISQGPSGFPSRNLLGLLHYHKMRRAAMISHFFTSTQEITMNMGLKSDKQYSKTNKKYSTFRNLGFDVVDPGQKYTGFEKIKDYYDENFFHLVTRSDLKKRRAKQSSTRVFDLLLRNKYEYEIDQKYPTKMKFRGI